MQIIEKQDSIDLFKKAKEYYKEEHSEGKLPNILDNIHAIFGALQHLVELLKLDKFKAQFKFINENNEISDISGIRSLSANRQQNVLLPLLSFMVNVSNEETNTYQFLRRLRKNYFDNLWSERKDKNYVDWRHIIQIIELCEKEEDILKYKTTSNTGLFKNISNVTLNEWYNAEEELKTKLKVNYQAEIELWEDHPDFMGDLSFLIGIDESIKSLNNTDDKFKKLELFYKNYTNLTDAVRGKRREIDSPDLIKLANFFRLFCLFSIKNIGHIHQCSYDFEGVKFSEYNRLHLKNNEFKDLCKSSSTSNLIVSFSRSIKNKINDISFFEFTKDNYTTERFVKAWLVLKVYQANQNNIVLSYDENYGVAAYIKNCLENYKIFDDQGVSIYNLYCGICNTKYVFPDCNIDSSKINTFFVKIENEKAKRTFEQFNDNKKCIDEIISLVLY